MAPTAVYRLYDENGDLLYVGMTTSPARRLAEHAETKFWWHEVDHDEIIWFDSRHEADDHERVAIWQEHPRYNDQSPVEDQRRSRRDTRALDVTWVRDSLVDLFDVLEAQLGGSR